MSLDMQNDNPGEGKIGDIITMNVSAQDNTNGLLIEVYGASENRPPRAIYTKLLVDKKPT